MTLVVCGFPELRRTAWKKHALSVWANRPVLRASSHAESLRTTDPKNGIRRPVVLIL